MCQLNHRNYEHLQTVRLVCILNSTFSSNFWPPTLPVDAILEHIQQEKCTQLPHYMHVRKLQQSVKAAFANAHSKSRSEESQFQVGDIVWLYTTAVIFLAWQRN